MAKSVIGVSSGGGTAVTDTFEANLALTGLSI